MRKQGLFFRWYRTLPYYERGWFWTPYTYRFGHGGWVFATWRKPMQSLRWLRRFWRGP